MADQNSILTLILRLKDETKAGLDSLQKGLANIKAVTAGAGDNLSGVNTSARSSAAGVAALAAELTKVKQAGAGIKELDINLAAMEKSARAVFQGIDVDLAAMEKAARSNLRSVDVDLELIEKSAKDAAAEMVRLGRATAAVGDSGAAGARGVSVLGEAADRTRSTVNGVTQGINNLTSGSERLLGTLRNVAVGLVGLKVVDIIKGFADTAARAQVLDTVLKTVALNAGISNSAITKLDKEVQSLGITAAASRGALTAFIQGGLDISKAAALARASQDLAVIAGEDSSTVFQRVITNIQQLDTMGLRYNGVVVSMDEAAAKFAKTIGSTAEALTQSQRQQALLNAVLEKGAEISGVYEKSMGDVGKQLSSLSRLQNDAAVSIGNNLLPAYLVLVQEFTIFLKQSKLITDEFSNQGEGAKKLAEDIRPIARALREVAVFIVQNIGLITTLVGAYLGLRVAAGAITALTTVVGGLVSTFRFLAVVIPDIIAGMLIVARSVIPALLTGIRALTAASLAFIATPVGAVIAAITAVVGLAIFAWNKYKNAVGEAAKTEALLANNGANLKNEIAAKYTERLRLVEEISAAEAALNEATTNGDQEAIKSAKERLDLAKKQNAELAAETAKLEALANKKGVPLDQSQSIADANKARKAVLDAAKEIQSNLEKLGLDSQKAFQGLNISKAFAEDLGRTEAVIDAFLKKIPDAAGGAAVSLGQVTLAISKMVEQAKSVDEFTQIITTLRNKFSGQGGAVVQALLDTASFNQEKAAVGELDRILAGYLGRIAEVRKSADLLRGIATDSANFVSGLRTTFFELGSGLQVASDGIVSFTGRLQSIAGSRAGLAALEGAQTQVAIRDAVQRYKTEADQINALDAKRRELVNADVNRNRESGAMLAAIDRDTNQRRLENAKQLYDSLKAQQQSYADKVRETLQRIRDLDKSISDSRRSESQALFDLQLSGLNEQEKKQAQVARIKQLDLEATVALQKQDFETAKAANEERLRLASSLAGSAKTAQERLEAEQQIKDAYAEQRTILGAQKKDEQDRLNQQVQALNDLTASLNALKETFSSLTQNQKVNVGIELDRSALNALDQELTAGKKSTVTLDVDRSSLDRLRTSIEDALRGLKFSLEGSATTISRASGGPVTGPGSGTSDDVLMWASNGEFVMKTAAVDHYGHDFMHRVNSLSLPRGQLPAYATGGLIGDPPGSPVSSGEKGDQVTLNLSLNGKRTGPVTGSRATVRGLVTALKDLERGVASA